MWLRKGETNFRKYQMHDTTAIYESKLTTEHAHSCWFNKQFFYFQKSSVGYQIRFDNRRPRKHGSITFCSVGILFQMLRTDPNLEGISHVIIDEVHERELKTDVVLALLKLMKRTNPSIKVMNFFQDFSKKSSDQKK